MKECYRPENLQEFWAKNGQARVSVNFCLGEDWVKSEMKVSSHARFYKDFDYQQKIIEECSERVEEKLGCGIGHTIFHGVVLYASLFGAEMDYPEDSAPWAKPFIEDPRRDIPQLIAKMEDVDLLDSGIMPRWREWWNRLKEEYDIHLHLGGWFRGPVTLGTMLCGTTNFVYYLHDYPELMKDLFELFERTAVEFMRSARKLTGASVKGCTINDHDAYLLSPGLFQEFACPVLEGIFDEFSPEERDLRRFHSGENVEHLLDSLAGLKVNEVSLGPKNRLETVKQKIPSASPKGFLPSLLIRDGHPEQIIEKVRECLEKAGNTKFSLSTCGGICENTPYENLLAVMHAVEKYAW